MPLFKSKSKKALSHNIEAEMDAGKPQDQALAIAYSIKRKAKKKMARGGMVNGAQDDQAPMLPASKSSTSMPQEDEFMDDEFADGGMVDRLMRQNRMKHMAEGGIVNIDENSEEASADPSPYDEMNQEASMKELYDDSQLSDQPEDSNEHGDMLSDEDAHDMVSQIRRKMKSRM